MRAISVKPQWADLIASGKKTLEIRSRRTLHRGPLLICATKPGGVARCVVNVTDCRPFLPQDAIAACDSMAERSVGVGTIRCAAGRAFPNKGAAGDFPRRS